MTSPHKELIVACPLLSLHFRLNSYYFCPSLPALIYPFHWNVSHCWCHSSSYSSEHLAQCHVHKKPSIGTNKGVFLSWVTKEKAADPPAPSAWNSPQCSPEGQCQAWSGQSGRCPGRAQFPASHPEEQAQ